MNFIPQRVRMRLDIGNVFRFILMEADTHSLAHCAFAPGILANVALGEIVAAKAQQIGIHGDERANSSSLRPWLCRA